MYLNALRSTLLFLSAALITEAHFVLQTPISLGFDDDAEGTSPCGGFAATGRTNVTNWPTGGSAINVLTTHSTATWEFKAARLSNLNHWVSLTRNLTQSGVGTLCEPKIPGRKQWEGDAAVLQVIQHRDDGALYQCAAIKFVRGPVAATPPDCVNSTGIAATWL
ncbi:hypothetical protein BGZ60DRAFT_436689 [Tricladium varicosporioides]|nr:hypothetical protein BGZ60DRAFT_436689 [Hymenoscyphus varicosporioides]